MNLKIILCGLFCFLGISLWAQVNPEMDNQQSVEDLIENIATASEDENADYTTIYEDLNYFLNNPLNLNSASEEDLEKLQVLNDIQIRSIIAYRENFGQFLTIYELQLVNGFDKSIIDKILPFLTVEKSEGLINIPIRKALINGNHEMFLRAGQMLEDQKGFTPKIDSSDSRYLGDKNKLYARYKFSYKNKLFWGITAEKDPGEEFFNGTQKKGFDYYSAHFQLSNVGLIKTLNIGDYNVKFGQGLTIWSGMGGGKSPYAINLRKKYQGINKYSSTDENQFMRGVGTTIRLKNFDVSAFYSRKNRDANIVATDTLNEEELVVSSLQITGLHTTDAEIADKDAIKETVMGGNVSYNNSRFKLGMSFVHYNFNAEINKQIAPYNQFELNKNQNTNIGLDYQFSLHNFNFFGEVATCENQSLGYLNGVTASLAPQVAIGILHRSYDRDYQAYYCGAFGESSGNSNESGTYIGLEVSPYKRFKISAYFDTYKFSWLRFGVDTPSDGYDYFAQLDYLPSRNVSMYIRIKHENKPVTNSIEIPSIDKLQNISNRKIRYNLQCKLNDNIKIKSRIELSDYAVEDSTSDKGYMIYQDVIYSFSKLPLSFSLRYAIFDTDTYNSRIYAFEDDVLYAFSIPAYYSKGSRAYLTLKYSLSEKIDIWLRAARTVYADMDLTGSGLTEIDSNHKTDFKVQIRIKF